MRVLHVIRDFKLTGVPRFLYQLITHPLFKLYDIENYVFSTHDGPLLEEFKQITKIFCLNKKFKYSFSPLVYLWKVCKSENIDILHIHSNFWGSFYAIFSKIPAVVTFHVSPQIDSLEGRIMYLCYKKLSKKNTRFICVSNHILNEVLKTIEPPLEKTKVIYNGIKIIDNNKSIYNKTREIIIGSVGSLSYAKGHWILIDALSNFGVINQKIKCYIVGDGPLKNKLLELIKIKSLNNHVFLLGSITFENFVKKYQPNIYILPSIHESFGLTILEAWNYGIPVIASDTEGPSEIIKHGETGLLFPTGDSFALAKSIRLLANNDEMRIKIVTNAKEMLKKFSIDITVNNYLQIYKEVTQK